MRERDGETDAWIARARAGSFHRAVELCGFRPAKGMGKGHEHAGPCPACGGRDRFAVNFSRRKFNCRKCGARGGDALALALIGDRLGFVEACEALSGEPRPQRIRQETEAEREARLARRRQMDSDAEADRQRREREDNSYRQREIAAALRIWKRGGPVGLEDVGAYLAARGCRTPSTAMLRFGPDVPYFHGSIQDETGRDVLHMIHRGPAMLAAIIDNAGAQIGTHITWLSADFRGKAGIFDPDTGEVLVSKKMRGSKRGGHIVLRQHPGGGRRLFLSEGIETGLSVAFALHALGRLRPCDMFWAAGDLGNLGGPHAGSVRHPTLLGPKGRPQRVAGPEPSDAGPAIVIPDSVKDLILLGDGDSDPFTTAAALERAVRRYARPGLVIRAAWAPQGKDFNNMLVAS